jgi:hypothetical protein
MHSRLAMRKLRLAQHALRCAKRPTAFFDGHAIAPRHLAAVAQFCRTVDMKSPLFARHRGVAIRQSPGYAMRRNRRGRRSILLVCARRCSSHVTWQT